MGFAPSIISSNVGRIWPIKSGRAADDCRSLHVTADEKAQLIASVSQLLLDVLHKPLDSTFVVIEEVELENWGWGGLPVAEFRKRRSPA